MRVLILLERGRGLRRWEERYAGGEVYDATPYGYGSAASDQVEIVFSEDAPESALGSFVRRGLRRLTGVDLVHVLRHVRVARRCDVIWTHMETEHLPLGVLKWLHVRLPPVVAQSVWLADRWPDIPRPLRSVFRQALRSVEARTTHSPVNAAVLASKCGQPVSVLHYGAATEPWSDVARERSYGRTATLRVLALGNDVHRDWPLVRELAIVGAGELEVRVLTRELPRSFAQGVDNLTVRTARTAIETAQSYAWADVVCLPLRRNLHASGLTVVFEATAWSLPVLVTDAGGLRDYFGDEEVLYMPLHAEAQDWLAALRGLHEDGLDGRVEAARRRARRDDYSAAGYARRNVLLSQQLLATEDDGS